MRKFIECRQVPNIVHCTAAIAAEREDELIEAAVQHAVAVHGEHDTPELRRNIRSALEEGSPRP